MSGHPLTATLRGLLVLSLAALSSLICSPLPANGEPSSYQQRIRQVELYIEGNLYEQALRELHSLAKTPEGAQDVRVAHSYALAHYNTSNVNQALFYLRRARSLTADDGLKSQLTRTYQDWIKSYGLVHFQSVGGTQQGAIHLSSDRNIVNPKRRKSFEVAQGLLAEGVSTPLSFYLPFGNYAANNVNFQLKASLPPPTVELMLTPVKSEPVSTTGSKWVYITLGGVALIATAVGGYYLMIDSADNKRLVNVN